MDVKSNFAQNLARYRKSLGLTQGELAERINYSDKAVSKWERGEALPDLEVVKVISEIFGTTIDDLVSEPKPEKKPRLIRNLPVKRAIICLAAAVLVWLVAVMAYAFLGVIVPWLLGKAWLALVVAIPVTFVVTLILTCVWGKNLLNAVFASLLSWTLLLAVYLCLINLLYSPPHTLWMIFLIGVPLQILIILWFSFKKVK